MRKGIYSEGVFRFSIDIPRSYPENPEEIPVVYFSSGVFHPLVDAFSGELNLKRKFQTWIKDRNFMWQGNVLNA